VAPAESKDRSKIPGFKTIEEAEFWDTRDTTEFLDEFEEVGVPYTTLIRMWTIKAFREEAGSKK
jgi:hypothetical protein